MRAEVKMKYRVYGGRADVPEYVVAEFEAESDGAALDTFQQDFVERPDLKWDGLRLVRVDVQEVVTSIASIRL